ncbi:MAG TPA: hypothetical protein VIN08_00375, partial [Ohtaekwangia sp.]
MAWNRVVQVIGLCLIVSSSFAQVNRYMVFFTDKEGTSYTTSSPLAFLSRRAITRRAQQAIDITEQDFPVNDSYVQGVRETGADVFYKTRWFNGALIQCDASLISTIQQLSFVDHVEYVAPGAKLLGNGRVGANDARSMQTNDVTTTQLG